LTAAIGNQARATSATTQIAMRETAKIPVAGVTRLRSDTVRDRSAGIAAGRTPAELSLTAGAY
jgi:hypothetical protein